jgi:hypothetical protein
MAPPPTLTDPSGAPSGVLLQDGAGRHLGGALAVAIFLLRRFLDVLVLALLLRADSTKMASSWHGFIPLCSCPHLGLSDLAGALGAAEHPALLVLHAVPDDSASAVVAGGGQRVDCALETVEGVPPPPGVDRKGLPVLVTAHVTARHLDLPRSRSEPTWTRGRSGGADGPAAGSR